MKKISTKRTLKFNVCAKSLAAIVFVFLVSFVFYTDNASAQMDGSAYIKNVVNGHRSGLASNAGGLERRLAQLELALYINELDRKSNRAETVQLNHEILRQASTVTAKLRETKKFASPAHHRLDGHLSKVSPVAWEHAGDKGLAKALESTSRHEHKNFSDAELDDILNPGWAKHISIPGHSNTGPDGEHSRVKGRETDGEREAGDKLEKREMHEARKIEHVRQKLEKRELREARKLAKGISRDIHRRLSRETIKRNLNEQRRLRNNERNRRDGARERARRGRDRGGRDRDRDRGRDGGGGGGGGGRGRGR